MDEVLGKRTVTRVGLSHRYTQGDTVYNEYVNFRSHCLIMPPVFITSFIYSHPNDFSWYGACFSDVTIFSSLMSWGHDFLHAVWKYIFACSLLHPLVF